MGFVGENLSPTFLNVKNIIQSKNKYTWDVVNTYFFIHKDAYETVCTVS